MKTVLKYVISFEKKSHQFV